MRNFKLFCVLLAALSQVFHDVVSLTTLCPSGCSTCETLTGKSYVIRATCSGVAPSYLPTTVREMRLTNVVFPGVLTPDSFENKTDLTLLQMTNSTGCSIIWEGAFSVCSKLNNLIIENTDLLQVAEKSFSGLVGLETLSLKHNNLMSINKAFVHLKKLTHLELDHNQLPEITGTMFQGLSQLFELTLSGNKIAKIAPEAFRDLTSLNALDLGYNKITAIESGLFQGLANLQMLVMKNNQISSIQPDAFNGTSVRQLDLNTNKFTSFPIKAFSSLSHPPQRLSFANNLIQKLTDYNFKDLNSTILDISYNKINSVSENAFGDCHLLMVQLDFNKISMLPFQMQLFWEKARSISIEGNDWICDCDLLWMVTFVSNSSPRKYKSRATAPMPSCKGGVKYANLAFNVADPLLTSECITTTATIAETTTELETTTAEITEETSSDITHTTTEIQTSQKSSTKTVTTTTTPPKTTSASTTKPVTSTVATTTKVSAVKKNSLFPGLWIGLAVLAALLVGGMLVYFFFFKDKRKKDAKVKPDEDNNKAFPQMPMPTMIQVQAPASTTMPNFSASTKKISDILALEANKIHNSRTLQTTSLA